MSLPSAAVVVCAYTLERWDDLCTALESAAGQLPAPDEICLVVDGNDALRERALAELVPRISGLGVVDNARRKGLSGARNTALEHVVSDVVVFLDDDATAQPGWLAGLLAPYADPSVLAVGGAAEPRWSPGHERPATLPAGPSGRGELDWVVGCTYEGQPTQTAAVRNLMGCNMSFRLPVFGEVGGFGEHLGRVGRTPLGCEETELCIRATNRHPAARVVFEPTALVRHHVTAPRLTWRYLLHRCWGEGISKAAVAVMVGRQQALSTERGYALRVLPRGVLRELRRAASGPDERVRGLAGAAAIVLGLAATTLGYVRGRANASAARAVPVDRITLRAALPKRPRT